MQHATCRRLQTMCHIPCTTNHMIYRSFNTSHGMVFQFSNATCNTSQATWYLACATCHKPHKPCYEQHATHHTPHGIHITHVKHATSHKCHDIGHQPLGTGHIPHTATRKFTACIMIASFAQQHTCTHSVWNTKCIMLHNTCTTKRAMSQLDCLPATWCKLYSLSNIIICIY